MEFTKTMMFLGMKRRAGEKGASYLVSMFCPGGDSWEFFVRDTVENNDIIAYLMRCSSGNIVDASFMVGKYTSDNRMFIRLTGVTDAA